MDKKICSECGTENERDYTYCKNCGAPLVKAEPEAKPEFIGNEAEARSDTGSFDASTGAGAYTPPYGAANYGGMPYSPYSPYNTYTSYAMDGVPAEDVAFFVGKKSAEIMPKIMKMEITRSNVSWCWPGAILGFLIGPLGAAIWFFYRKMYKIALILLAIGTVLSFTKAALTLNADSQDMSGIFDSITEGDADALLDAFRSIESEETAATLLASGINSIAGLATCVLTGLFGFYAYKNHCVKSIKGFIQNGIDQRYYRMGLASLGGVSGGMLAVGIISMIVIENIASTVMVVLSAI